MLRSLFAAFLARQQFTITVAGRIVQRALPAVSQSSRSLHQSTPKLSDDDSSTRSKNRRAATETRSRPEKTKLRPVSAELKKATINVAKSLPGDWTKTAEELMSRLQLHQNPETKSEAAEPLQNDKSLLQTMGIGRPSKGRPERRQMNDSRPARVVDHEKDDDMFSRTIVRTQEAPTSRTRQVSRVARRLTVKYTDLFGAPRLGIFDADKLKKESDKQLVSQEPDDLWARVDAEYIRRSLGALPRNAFEEMIQWTKEGKLWKFPINNEADMDEERKYKFHDHVFLERHLSEFPDKGPIRKFMELVCLGLSMNPWISVPEKVDHIKWFGQYFREKQDILETAIGEQGKMKETEQIE